MPTMPTLEQAQKTAAQAAALAIVGAAIVLTYTGTAQFCHAHGAPGWRGYTIAAMNDAAVLVGIVWPERALQALALLCALFTGWANFAHAAPGWAGNAVALTPPILAFLMIAALEHVLRTTGRPLAGPASVSVPEGTSDTVTGQDTDTREDTGPDTEEDRTPDTDRTPDRTSEGTPTGQDTGHQEDTGQDTEPDTGQGTDRTSEEDIPQVTARSDMDTGPDNVRPIRGVRAKVIADVVAGRMTQAVAAQRLDCSVKTVGRAVAAARRARQTEAVG